MKYFVNILLLVICLGCKEKSSYHPIVTLETTFGEIKIKLYNDTPIHRDNFIKIAKEGILDSVLFHRVIKNFMIQGGDPTSKHAKPGALVGEGDLGYKLQAELVYPKHYHKRGVVAAARESDKVNPQKESSASQFYIVTGKLFTDEELVTVTNRKNSMIHNFRLQYSLEQNKDLLQNMLSTADSIGINQLYQQLRQKANDTLFQFPNNHKMMYHTIGGAPHLDGDYTIFGEVIQGMEVVDSIQNCPVDANNRPVKDIRVIRVDIR